MKFIDEAIIEVIAGKGGDGSASFRREKFVPFGGPDGGDGGRGGSIIAVANRNINTLVEYRYTRKFQAKNGENGHGSDCYGRSAENITLHVPVGTIVINHKTGDIIADLQQDKQEAMLAKGGEGGLGNLHFKSSTNRAPRQKTNGKEGEQYLLRLELRVLADVGLFGLPNAGKSTFISAISNSKPKIADYPFTTLSPNLGVVRVNESFSFVLADLPGLVEGAASGKGLGHRFLRHIQRCHLLLHFIDLSSGIEESANLVKQAKLLAKELELYDQNLQNKPRWIVFNKIDVLTTEKKRTLIDNFIKNFSESIIFFEISALTKAGCQNLLQAIAKYFVKTK